jgi:hypothetical protein
MKIISAKYAAKLIRKGEAFEEPGLAMINGWAYRIITDSKRMRVLHVVAN